MLDTTFFKIYRAAVVHRCAAVSILAVWPALFGIDMGDDSGLIQHLGYVDCSVDAVLSDFGRAIDISDGSGVAASAILTDQSGGVHLRFSQCLGIENTQSVPQHRVRQETGLLKLHQNPRTPPSLSDLILSVLLFSYPLSIGISE